MISKRNLIVFSYDVLTIPLAWLLAYWVRFNLGLVPQDYLKQAFLFLIPLLIVQAAVFALLGVYRGHWRFVSIADLIRILKAVLLGALVCLLIFFLLPRDGVVSHSFPPRSVFLIYILALIALLSGARLAFRYFKHVSFKVTGQQRTLIIGAGHAGEMLARDLLRDPNHRYCLIGYLDDLPKKRGTEIHGIRVLGTTTDLARIVQSHQIELVLIAIPSASSKVMRTFVTLCNEAKVAYRTLPSLNALASGKVSAGDLREVSLEDLLHREPVHLDDAELHTFFQHKKVMVTGGGGSIGSELCRQIASFAPTSLIVLDQSEFNIYIIDQELRQQSPHLNLYIHLEDVTHYERVRALVAHYKPEIIFHAAAYKHVPLLENHIDIAISNNLLGTHAVARAAIEEGVSKFVLVSTDKAVNPSNVMGSTKRMAEILCQSYNGEHKTQFMTVRFGNVLGSTGSVVPLFKKQIAAGGPVTITHPEMTRYFMTIPEASQLILWASLVGQGGEIYVLDMGQPVKIRDLAEQLILLSGKRVGEDIEIISTGLRPGEKLYEELFYLTETLEETGHPKLLKAKSTNTLSSQEIAVSLETIRCALKDRDEASLFAVLKKWVPESQLQHA